MADYIEPQQWDSHSDAGDSTYDETACSTASVTSSIFEYEQEHGRTYHAFHAGKYMLPNDEGEQERMDLHYHSLRLTFQDKLFHAPVRHPTAFLDVGTGTGIWAMDVADEFPAATVIGIDLSPIQPGYVPPNLQFEIFDAEEHWDHMYNRFDLIHTRFMNGFSLKSWPRFYEQAFMSAKPGGWVENQEFDLLCCSDDNSLPEDSYIKQWEQHWNRAVGMAGATGRCYPRQMAQQMIDAGFINVTVREFKLPIGPWPKDRRLREAGVYSLLALVNGLYGLSVKLFTRFLEWSNTEVEEFLAKVTAQWKSKSIHSYWPVYVLYGQKPESVP